MLPVSATQLLYPHSLSSVYLSDVWAQLQLKAMALAQPGGAHGLAEGQAEPRLSRRSRPQLGLVLFHVNIHGQVWYLLV